VKSKTEYINFGRMSSGKKLPARNHRKMEYIYRGAQISLDQNAKKERFNEIKKAMMPPMRRDRKNKK
jgi:hypothetical protein